MVEQGTSTVLDTAMMIAAAKVPIGTKQGWDYEDDQVLVLPYLPQSADNGLPEDFLVRLFLQTRQDGLLEQGTYLLPVGKKAPTRFTRFHTTAVPDK